jgi:putative transposase
MTNKRILPGQLVFWKKESAVVHELKGLSEAVIRTVEGKTTEIVRISDLATSLPSVLSTNSSHLNANDVEWNEAVSRYEIIKPILESSSRSVVEVEKAAQEANKSVPTIYRWLKKFDETGLVSSLLRPGRSDKGSSRIDPEQEAVISKHIESFYLKKERPSVQQLHKRIAAECYEIDIPFPHVNTIYRRVKELDERVMMRSRYSPKSARQKFEPLRGKFPGGLFPNAVVQIDHTPVDVIVVDEKHRLPIGRPYLTIAIDVATKMITGFRMTLDPPSASSAGLCVAHAICGKEHWLAKREILAEWPIQGKMEMIHLDNAKEFRGKMLERACSAYGIIIENRPNGQPNYGPHVERAFRTFMQESHSLPGSTFSNVSKKLEYDSEGHACFTLSELEMWFTVFVVYCYHNQPHRGINKMAPIKLFNQMVHGTDTMPGVGLPAPVEDEETLRLHFTPYVSRAIQRDGVVIDNVHYYSPLLRKWVARKDPLDSSKNRQYIFARDPRDISQVYFFDPETETYASIPYLNNTRPAISLWELNAVKKQLSDTEYHRIDENIIFQGIARMREIEENAVEKTRLARQQRSTEKRKRRMSERREHWKGIHKQPTGEEVKQEEDIDESLDIIEPFDDIQLEF